MESNQINNKLTIKLAETEKEIEKLKGSINLLMRDYNSIKQKLNQHVETTNEYVYNNNIKNGEIQSKLKTLEHTVRSSR